MNQDISSIRRNYQFKELLESDAPADPLTFFDEWLQQAIKSCPYDPTAMTLSTVDANNAPHARVVLLKQREEQGFVFFTNYHSGKGQELANNNQACLTFFWAELSRQIRIEGSISKTSRDTSASYFATRPKESQIAASASQQSEIITRSALHDNFDRFADNVKDKDVVCPEHWGGYCLVPHYIEFWQGRPNRLHDRLCYQLDEQKGWSMVRKAP